MTAPGPGAPEVRQILVIDDGADNRLLLSAVLKRAGYEPLLAEHGEAGLAMLSDTRPALILLDYSMPGLSGPEVARVIRARPELAHVPIIVLTASADEAHVEEAFAAGADDYIVKPFDRRILLARIESMIRAAGDRRHRDQLLGEFEQASRVQRSIASELPRDFAGGTIMGATVSCQHIGGDVIAVLDGAPGVTIAMLIDVSGHGAAAAMVASSMTAELRELARTRPLADCLAALNQHMTSAGAEYYACIGALAIAERSVTIVNAGLPPICLIRDGRIADRVEACGVPPGLLAGSRYGSVAFTLRPGDRLVVLSDGLTEPLGEADDVAPCLAALELLVPGGLWTHDDVTDRIRAMFGGRPLVDDATLIVVDCWHHRVGDLPGGVNPRRDR